MENAGNVEDWILFLNKEVKVIVEDSPSPYPKSKIGLLSQITSTHLIIIKQGNQPEALRLSDIRRVELL